MAWPHFSRLKESQASILPYSIEPKKLLQVKNKFKENFPRYDEQVLKYAKHTISQLQFGKGWIKLQ